MSRTWRNLWGLRKEGKVLPAAEKAVLARPYVTSAIAGPATSVSLTDGTKRTSVTDVTPSALHMPSNTIIAPVPFSASNWYDLESVSKTDGHISYAIHNICTLGNTPFNVSFSEGLSDDEIQELHEIIRVDFPNMYAGGLLGLRQQFFRQLAVYGAISYEMLIKRDLTGLGGVALVNPKHIRFYYDTKTNKFVPIQVQFGYFASSANLSPQGYINLNPYTYKYVPMETENDNPYGIPPFLSAIDPAMLDNKLNSQYKNMIEKVGMMGFLIATINPGVDFGVDQTMPGYGYDQSNPYNPNAAESTRKARVEQLMKDTAAELAKSVDSGILVGVEGTHDFKFNAPLVNVEAANGIQSINTSKKVAGIKQPGLMLGADTGSTTETLGRVLMAKATASIKVYQGLVDAAISDIIRAHLVLRGKYVKYVLAESTPPIIGDEVRDAQAYHQKVETHIALYKQGIVSQSQMAQALGFDKPASPSPREEVSAQQGPATPRDQMPASQQNRYNNPTGARTTDPTNQRRS